MSKTESAAQVIAELCEILARVDVLEAPVAAAYVDSAIEALCREFGVARDSSRSD